LRILSELNVFEGIGPGALAMLATAFAFAYFLKGAFGVGALTPAILFGSLVLPAHHAVMLAILANASSQLQFIPEGFRAGDRALVRRVILPLMSGGAIGITIFANLDGRLLTFILGVALGIVVAADLFNLIERLTALVDIRSQRAVWSLAGFSGLVTGVTGAGGLFFLAVYLKLACPSPRVFRGTTFLLSAVGILWRTIVLAIAGFVTLQILAETLLLLPIVVLGGWLGDRLHHKLPARTFFKGVQVLLLIGALGLIAKGWPW
jgi:uncharacterized membrane protein YfcA